MNQSCIQCSDEMLSVAIRKTEQLNMSFYRLPVEPDAIRTCLFCLHALYSHYARALYVACTFIRMIAVMQHHMDSADVARLAQMNIT